MMMHHARVLLAIPALVAGLLLGGCERPDMETAQIGYRGTGMEKVTNPRIVAAEAANWLPAYPEEARPLQLPGYWYQNAERVIERLEGLLEVAR